MKFIRKFVVKYVDSSEQYASIDFEENDIIDAEYVKVSGFEGLPDIEALPKPLTGTKAVNEGTHIPASLTNKETKNYLKIYAMRDLRFPMVNQGEINKRLHEGLLFSYSNRSYAYTESPIKIKTNDSYEDITINILTSTRMCGETNSSALIGLPGTGKSTALSIAIQRYPRAIKHTFENEEYIQIPIVRTTAFANSNLNALFYSFASTLDEILDSGNRYREELGKNLGQNVEKIISWIKQLHIGCWIIEEAEFFSFSSTSTGSFENIVTIMQETGVFLFTTGNHDLVNKLNGNLRLERRLLANYIDMDLVHKNKDFMKSITARMWGFLLPEIKTKLTEEMFDEIYEWTLGSIDMISILLISLQQEYESKRKKGDEKIKLNKSFIKEVGKAKLTRMRKLFLSSTTNLAVEEYRQAQIEFENSISKELQIIENANIQAELQQDIVAGYDHAQKYVMVRESIQKITDNYSENKIKNAFCFCEENVDTFKKMSDIEMSRIVYKRLEDIKTNVKKKQNRKVEVNLEELQKELLKERKHV